MLDERFTHLHVHTDASVLDGLGLAERTVRYAKHQGYRKLAMTDHGSLSNAIVFSQSCIQNGIKPLIGMEGYIVVDGQIGHITLLADGDAGFTNLVKLNNLAQASPYKRPAFSVDQLVKHADNLVCLSGCVASPMQSMSLKESLSLGRRLKKAFGKRFIAEIMFVADMDTWSRPLEIAERLNIPTVLTNDVHFAKKSDGPVHNALTQMKAGFEYESKNLWLRTPDEMMDAWKEKRVALPSSTPKADIVEKAMANSVRLGKLIKPPNLIRPPALPVIEDADLKLRREISSSLDVYSCETHSTEDVDERIEFELGIVEKMGFSTYFMILKEIVFG